MLPLVDRPFVQHVVEFLAAQGVTRFDFVVEHSPDPLEHHLGDGARWGCRLTYHQARHPARPYEILRRLDLKPCSGTQVLLGHADRLPVIQVPGEDREKHAREAVLFMSPGAAGGAPEEWTGWGLFTAPDLLAIPGDISERRLAAHLLEDVAAGVVLSRVKTVLSVRSAAEMLAAQRAVLEKQVSGLLLSGRERAPGVWVAARAKVSPTAELSAPVFIGPDCTVGASARIGPHVVVGAGCLIDRACGITNSTVFPGSYVGEGMVLDGALVDGPLAVNSRDNSTTEFVDLLSLGRVPNPPLMAAFLGLRNMLAYLGLACRGMLRQGLFGRSLSPATDDAPGEELPETPQYRQDEAGRVSGNGPHTAVSGVGYDPNPSPG